MYTFREPFKGATIRNNQIARYKSYIFMDYTVFRRGGLKKRVMEDMYGGTQAIGGDIFECIKIELNR